MSLESKPPRAKNPHTAIVVASQPLERTRIAQALRPMFTRVIRVRDPFEAISQSMADRVVFLVVSLEGLASGDAKFIEPVRRHSLDVRTLLLVPEGKRPVARVFLKAGADGMLSSPHDDREFRFVVRSMMRSDGPDALTGLPNRAAADRAVPLEIARAERDGRSLGFAILDLDLFHNINDAWGYIGGDTVLVNVARILRQTFRVTDLVCRWGGEEFMVLLPGLPLDFEAARKAACLKLQSVKETVAAWIPPLTLRSGGPARVTLSGGLSICPSEAKDPIRLFELANWRLSRRAKVEGRNRIECDDKLCPHRPTGPPPPLVP